MNLKIRRRRFAQLVVGSAVATAVTNLAGNKTFAQDSQLLVGARFSSNKNKQTKTASTDLENTVPAVSLVSLDLTTGSEQSTTEVPATTVDNKNSKAETANKAVYTEPTERITGLAALSDGTFILVIVGADKKGNYSKLLITDRKSANKSKSKKISGFKKNNNTIEGIVATKDDKLIAIASETGGTPPFYFIGIDPKNGKVTSADEFLLPVLPSDVRLSNLALGADGNFYATTLERDSGVTLVQLNPQKTSVVTGRLLINEVVKLSYNKAPLVNDLLSLTFSPTGQLIGLANLNNETSNSLLAIDMKTGETTLLSKVVVDRVVYPRS
jgi:hypothetical protein